jgi:uncharacterized protein (DUF433 family)/DNA-binding transcriptional MerR regulator
VIKSESNFLAQGVFSIPEASILTGVPAAKLRRWFGGDEAVFEAAKWDDTVNLSFAELVSALFIRSFRDHGVSMQTIRASAAIAAKQFQHDRPFALANFTTDGRSILRWMDEQPRDHAGDRRLVDVKTGQTKIVPAIRQFLKDIEFGESGGGNTATRWWPLGRGTHVMIDPKIAMGRPITAKSYTPTRPLYLAHSAGDSVKTIAAWFGVAPVEVRAAVRFEEQLQARAA